MDIPTSPAAITPAWLTEALRHHLTGGVVTEVDAEDIGEGTGIFGEIARLRLSYDGTDGPSSLVAKMPCREPENLVVAQALGIYEREVNFFNEIAPQTPLRIPHCFLARLGDNGGFVLLLEDMSAEYDVGDQVVGATVAQAEAAIDSLR